MRAFFSIIALLGLSLAPTALLKPAHAQFAPLPDREAIITPNDNPAGRAAIVETQRRGDSINEGTVLSPGDQRGDSPAYPIIYESEEGLDEGVLSR